MPPEKIYVLRTRVVAFCFKFYSDSLRFVSSSVLTFRFVSSSIMTTLVIKNRLFRNMPFSIIGFRIFLGDGQLHPVRVRRLVQPTCTQMLSDEKWAATRMETKKEIATRVVPKWESNFEIRDGILSRTLAGKIPRHNERFRVFGSMKEAWDQKSASFVSDLTA